MSGWNRPALGRPRTHTEEASEDGRDAVITRPQAKDRRGPREPGRAGRSRPWGLPRHPDFGPLPRQAGEYISAAALCQGTSGE